MKAENISEDLLRHRVFELVVEQELTIGEAARRLQLGNRKVYSLLRQVNDDERMQFDVTEFLRLKKQLGRITAERDLLQRLLMSVMTKDEIIQRTDEEQL